MHTTSHRLHPLQWAMALCATATTLSALWGHFGAYATFKPLTMVIALACVWQLADRHHRSTWLLLAGLALSLIGDVCLLTPRTFLPGLVAFLLAHLCYIALFARDSRWQPHKLALLACLLAGAGIYAYLWTHGLPTAMRIPVAAYVLVITLMAAQAIGRATVLRTTPACCVAAGAIIFVLSDTTLAIDKFVAPVPAAQLWVLGTYYVAQWLIVHGMLPTLRASRP